MVLVFGGTACSAPDAVSTAAGSRPSSQPVKGQHQERLEIVVQAIDEQGRPLPIIVGGPAYEKEDPWSTYYTGTDYISQMRVSWKPVKPLPLTVSSNGYEPRTVVVDERTPSKLPVQLKKSGK
jgi:hypothetical protein